MDDRELLEAAAKAMGYDTSHPWNAERAATGIDSLVVYKNGELVNLVWNPLVSDRDALRLAVVLGISITHYPIYGNPKHSVIAKQYRKSDTMREANPTEYAELYIGNPGAATRRAIVRSAAALVAEK